MKLIIKAALIISVALIIYPGAFYVYWFWAGIFDPGGAIRIERKMELMTTDVLIKKMYSIDPFSPYPDMAMSILGKKKEKAAIPHLVRKLRSWNGFTREDAIRALAEIGDKGTIPLLLDLVKSKTEKDYEYKLALEALAGMGSEEAFPYIIQLAKGHDGASISMLKAYGRQDTIPLLEAMREDMTGEKTTDSLRKKSIDEAIEHIKLQQSLGISH